MADYKELFSINEQTLNERKIQNDKLPESEKEKCPAIEFHAVIYFTQKLIENLLRKNKETKDKETI
jgi:hypothetical protein